MQLRQAAVSYFFQCMPFDANVNAVSFMSYERENIGMTLMEHFTKKRIFEEPDSQFEAVASIPCVPEDIRC